jgi:uncharacterized damage-inducible protein DinB
MSIAELLLAQLDREAPITRRALEAVPEGKGDWKPHARSMPLGRLASLVAMMPAWFTMMIEQDDLDVRPPAGTQSEFQRELKTRAELLKVLDESAAGARTALQNTTEEHLLETWRLKAQGKVVAEAPRYVMMMDTFTHIAHHRGQLTVYLRMNDAKVPAIYGPSADDQSFG